MTLIEGIGDEVTLVCGAFIVFVILAIAWLSTGVSDRPLFNIVVLERNGFQGLIRRLRNSAFTILGPDGRPMSDSEVSRLTDDAASGNASSNSPSTGASPPNEEAVPPSTAPANSETRNDNGHVAATNQVDSNISCTSDDKNSQPSDKTPSESQASGNTSTQEPSSEGAASARAIPETEIRLRRVALLSAPTVESAPQVPKSDSNSESAAVVTESDNKPTMKAECVTSASLKTECVANPSVKTDSVADASVRTESVPIVTESSASDVPSDSGVSEGPSGLLKIRLKYLDERQREVEARPQDTVGEFKRKHFAGELAENLAVRFIYNGQELRQDSWTLQSYNVRDSSVIHCLFSQRQIHVGAASSTPHQGELDIGRLMFPAFALVLAMMWYGRFTYRNYFNAMSTFALVGISFLFIVALLAAWRTQDAGEHQE